MYKYDVTIGGKEKLIKPIVENDWRFILRHSKRVAWSNSRGTFRVGHGSRNKMTALLKAKCCDVITVCKLWYI